MALVEHDTRWGPPPSPPAGPPTPTPSRRNHLPAAIIASVVVVLAVVVIAATATGVSHHTKPAPRNGATAPPNTNPAPRPTAPTASTPVTGTGTASSPADWPAAQPYPPSLAAAANTGDMATVVRTLLTYKDWVYVHPN